MKLPWKKDKVKPPCNKDFVFALGYDLGEFIAYIIMDDTIAPEIIARFRQLSAAFLHAATIDFSEEERIRLQCHVSKIIARTVVTLSAEETKVH